MHAAPELRFQSRLKHPVHDAYLYSFRFRMMPKDVGDKENSIRWVTAQWKQEPVSDEYPKKFGKDWSQSPFLSQRYDDGVLYVAVADEDCRCTIASARLPGAKQPVWTNGTPSECVSLLKKENGKKCPAHLDVQYGKDPVLPSPADNWVEMSYRVQAGRSGRPFIDIMANGNLIARVTGKIGYEPRKGETSMTKFKIGHYRDYMPFEDQIEVDWLKVRPAPK